MLFCPNEQSDKGLCVYIYVYLDILYALYMYKPFVLSILWKVRKSHKSDMSHCGVNEDSCKGFANDPKGVPMEKLETSISPLLELSQTKWDRKILHLCLASAALSAAQSHWRCDMFLLIGCKYVAARCSITRRFWVEFIWIAMSMAKAAIFPGVLIHQSRIHLTVHET